MLTNLSAQKSDIKHKGAIPPSKTKVVEAACGQCQFDMKGSGCDLAIRMEGKSYFVKGTHIDQHGDAHAEDGFCNAIRKAAVKGKIRKGYFFATYFQLTETHSPL